MPTRETAHPGLAACRDAEDYFRLLGVDYDERVLAAGRLHVLELFGRELAAIEADLAAGGGATGPDDDPEAAGLPRYRAALERAYTAVRTEGPLHHRVFKVLRDRRPGQFVPVETVAVDSLGPDGGELL